MGAIVLRASLALALTMVMTAAAAPDDARMAAAVDAQEGRGFYMGFTPWPYDETPEAIDRTYETLKKHGDLICYHFDNGIPWPEAYDGKPYPAAVEAELKDREARLDKDHKLLLSLAPLSLFRTGIADYWSDDHHRPRPAAWADKKLDDPMVIQAYTNFALDLIDRFKVDFFNYGVEVGGLPLVAPEAWPAFVTFTREVYGKIKEKHPELPLFLCVPLQEPDKQKELNEKLKEVMPYSDWIGISFYGFMTYGTANPNELPENWLSLIQDLAPEKPLAVVETAWHAEPIKIADIGYGEGLNVEGKPEWQKDYASKLLENAQTLDVRTVVWWCPIDYDKLLEGEDAIPAAYLWKDTGLYDGDLKPRPALEVWESWRKKPYARPGETAPATPSTSDSAER